MNIGEASRSFCPALLALLICAATKTPAQPPAAPLKQGTTIHLGGGAVTIVKLDVLPYVENEYTKRFRFDSADNPKLKELRQRYQLDAVVAPVHDEFDRQVLLLDWVHSRFKRFGRPTVQARGALEILRAIDDGAAFFCTQYAEVFVSAAASLGWVARPLALRRHQDKPGGGSTEHTTTELWSNQHRKWVMLDPTAKMFIEKDGVPLSAYEIRQEWFYREGRDLVFVVGKERKKYRKADLPIFLGRFAGFGDLTVPVDELDKYGFIGYVPNTDLMDSGFDYGRMVIVKDQLCEGTRWHTRPLPANPEADLYWPIGQTAVSLDPEQDRLRVLLRTLTPNFGEFHVRRDGAAWTPSEPTFLWGLRPGTNRLEARAVNRFGVEGPVSTVEVVREDAPSSAPRAAGIGSQRVNVIVINFDPVLKTRNHRKLHEHMKWSDPWRLTEQMIQDARQASGGYVDYRIVEKIEYDGFPTFRNGFRYTEESFLRMWEKDRASANRGMTSFKWLFEQFDLAAKIKAKDVREIWLWGAPYMQWDELHWKTPGDKIPYQTDNPWFYRPYDIPDVGRTVWIMGWNYERGEGEMLESYAHRIESVLSLTVGQGVWDPKRNPDNVWNRFTRVDKDFPGEAEVGTVHYAPNSRSDYDWSNTNAVWTYCDDWLTYPHLPRRKKLLNAVTGGWEGIVRHHLWWMEHMPRAPGVTDGFYNNWWQYIVNYDEALQKLPPPGANFQKARTARYAD